MGGDLQLQRRNAVHEPGQRDQVAAGVVVAE
jgi:hypothetical protein